MTRWGLFNYALRFPKNSKGILPVTKKCYIYLSDFIKAEDITRTISKSRNLTKEAHYETLEWVGR